MHKFYIAAPHGEPRAEVFQGAVEASAQGPKTGECECAAQLVQNMYHPVLSAAVGMVLHPLAVLTSVIQSGTGQARALQTVASSCPRSAVLGAPVRTKDGGPTHDSNTSNCRDAPRRGGRGV